MKIEYGRSANEVWSNYISILLNAPVTKHPVSKPLTGQTWKPSHEYLGLTSCVDMTRPVVTFTGRKLDYRFMFAEAIWILSGSDKLAEIYPYCKPYARFSDDGVILAGAYGPRFIEQIRYVINLLREDITTRQAVMSFWKPSPSPSKDIPCTLSTQFLVRNGMLHLVHSMRSSDTWLGWPYDIFSFTMIALYVILNLREKHDLQLGNIYFRAGSQHLYLKDYKAAWDVMIGTVDSIGYLPLDAKDFQDIGQLFVWLVAMRDGAGNQNSPLIDLQNYVISKQRNSGSTQV